MGQRLKYSPFWRGELWFCVYLLVYCFPVAKPVCTHFFYYYFFAASRRGNEISNNLWIKAIPDCHRYETGRAKGSRIKAMPLQCAVKFMINILASYMEKVEVSLIAHPFPARVGIVWFCRDWRKLLQTKHEVRGKWLICCSCCQCCFRTKKQIKSEDKFPTIPEIQLRVEPKKTKKLASILWNFKTWAFCCTLCLNSSLVSPYIKRKLCGLLKVC